MQLCKEGKEVVAVTGRQMMKNSHYAVFSIEVAKRLLD
jgi:hypothetical protein